MTAASAGADTPGRLSIPALLALAAAVGNGFLAQTMLSPLQEAVRLDLGLTDFQMSLTQGLAVSIPIALLAIPLGRLVDRANRVRLLFALAATWTAGTVLTALADGFAQLFVARMLAGIGMMCSLPVAISIAADLSPPDRRGLVMLILSIGKIIGVAAAFAAGGALLAQSGWRDATWAFAIASVVLMLPMLFLREPARHELGDAAGAPLGVALRAIWQRRALLAPLFLGQVTVVMADAAAAVWAAPVLVRDYGQQPAQFGAWLGGIVLLSGLLGSIIGGIAADFGQKGRVPGGILGGAALAALLSVPAALFPVMPGVGGFAVMLTILLVGGAVTGLVTAAAIAVLVPNEIRGVCLGAFIVVAAVIGLGAAPTLVTLVSDALGGEAHVREGLTIVGLAASALSAFGFVRAVRRERAAA